MGTYTSKTREVGGVKKNAVKKYIVYVGDQHM